jgi:aromatic ring-cleaving dioxygenase
MLGTSEMHYREGKGAMSMPGNLHGYHVHIYYDGATEQQATNLHDRMVAEFQAKPSRPPYVGIAGPHPVGQRAVIFSPKTFTAEVVPWLMFNRQGLSILIHPLSDDEYEAHTTHAVWFGEPIALLTDKLSHAPPSIPELMP